KQARAANSSSRGSNSIISGVSLGSASKAAIMANGDRRGKAARSLPLKRGRSQFKNDSDPFFLEEGVGELVHLFVEGASQVLDTIDDVVMHYLVVLQAHAAAAVAF